MSSNYFAAERPLTRQDARTLSLSFLGGALEFYDFIIFVFFASVIGKLFFPADMPSWLALTQAYGIFAAGYLARPVGGIIMAHFGDRIGRKRMFTLSVFMMAAPTLIIGVLPTYESIGYAAPLLLLVMRLFQGAAIGGELPGAWVFVAEHVPARRVGMAVGFLTGGVTSGILLGSLAATIVNTSMSPEDVVSYGWRLAFILGGVFGLVVVYLRQFLEETPVFKEISEMKMLSEGLPLKEVLRAHRPAIILSVMVTWLLTASVVVAILMTPTLLSKLYNLPMANMLVANSIATAALSVGCILVGLLCDKFGPSPVIAIWSVCLTASFALLYWVAGDRPDLILPIYGVVGFFVSIIAITPIVMVRIFPPAIRFSGISFSYNLAYAAFGGLTPMLIVSATASWSMAPAAYLAVAVLFSTAWTLAYRHLYKMR